MIKKYPGRTEKLTINYFQTCVLIAEGGCTYSSTTTTTSPISAICPPGTWGNVPHPEICNAFYMCAGEQPIKLYCSEGFEFDPELKVSSVPGLAKDKRVTVYSYWEFLSYSLEFGSLRYNTAMPRCANYTVGPTADLLVCVGLTSIGK